MSFPSGYKEVEYLEATGTQYIQTDILAVPGTYLEIDYQWLVLKTSELILFYANNLDGSTGSDFYCRILNSKSGAKAIKVDNITFGLGNHATKANQTVLNVEHRYTTKLKDVDSSYEVYDVTDNEIYKSGTVGTYHINEDVQYYPLLIFNDGVEARLYRFRAGKNGVLEHDLVPALDDNETPCMYDKITGTTYYNSGTGNFLYGDPIGPSTKQRLFYTYENGSKVLRFLRSGL